MACLAGPLGALGRKVCPPKQQVSPVQELRIEQLLAGDHIRAELHDTRINSEAFGLDAVVREATKMAREVTEKHPVFVFGDTGVGKSSLSNALLTALGETSRPAATDNLKPCTRGVDMYGCRTQTRAGPGQLLLFDTEGWELGKAAPILHTCMRQSEQQGIPLEVLHNRLVLILVISANSESQRHLDSPKFRSLVQQICREFHRLKLKDRVKPVFVPVVSQIDKVEQEDRVYVRRNVASKLREAVGNDVMFQEPILISSKTSENVDQLCGRLRDIFDMQLQSADVLTVVRQLIHEDLLRFLRSWHGRFDGLEAESALVRRHIWSVARSYGLGVSNLEASLPAARWRDAERACAELRRCQEELRAKAAGRRGGACACLEVCGGRYRLASGGVQTADVGGLHVDSLRRHVARAGELPAQQQQPAAQQQRAVQTPVASRSRERLPALRERSIDLTHLRDEAGSGKACLEDGRPAEGAPRRAGSSASIGESSAATTCTDDGDDDDDACATPEQAPSTGEAACDVSGALEAEAEVASSSSSSPPR